MGRQVRNAMRIAAAALAVAAALVLAGCSGGGSYTPPEKTPTISSPALGQDGVLRVGVNADKSPLSGKASDGHLTGIDIDVAAALADSLGLKVSIVDVGIDPEGALTDGDVDVVLGIDKADTSTSFWKSSIYLPTGIALFADSSDTAVPQAGGGATFAVQQSSTSSWAVANEFGEAALSPYQTLGEAFEALDSGKVRYVAADAVVGLYYARGEDASASPVALLQQASGYCVGVLDGNTELKTTISDTVSTLSGNGVIGLIQKKWLGSTVDLSQLPMTAGATSAKATDTGSTSGDAGANAVVPGATGTASGAAGAASTAAAA